MIKIMIVLIVMAIAFLAAVRFDIIRLKSRKTRNKQVPSSEHEDNSYEIDNLIVGKSYGDCPITPASAESEESVSTAENDSTFAPQDVRGDEPPTAGPADPAEAGSQNPAPNGTDSGSHIPRFTHELILVDGDPELDEEPEDDTRALTPIRPAIQPMDTGKILDELVYDDQPEFEADATESERKEMESFDMKGFS